MRNICVIFDGSYIIYRAYYATHKTREEGNQEEFYITISAIQRTIRTVFEKLGFDSDEVLAIAAMDSSRKTFRSDKFSDYKTNRKSMPELLKNNLEWAQKTFSKFGLKIRYAPENYEADDLIASLSNKYSSQGLKTIIVSADKDLLQLVNENVSVLLISAKGYIRHTHQNFERLNEGLLPFQIPLYKAIAGDKSDNYKGLPGIGHKTAIKWLLKYKTIENIYKNLEDFSEKERNILISNRESLDLFLCLSHLQKDLFKDKKENEVGGWAG